jgi:hypothetical protein
MPGRDLVLVSCYPEGWMVASQEERNYGSQLVCNAGSKPSGEH